MADIAREEPPQAGDVRDAVALTGVIKNFGARVVTRVLRGIDLRIEAGQFTALVGPSGSGKSTLLNLIGLLDRPTAGRVAIGGKATDGMDDAALTRLRAAAIGFVFQFHHLLPAFTALENVMLPGLASGAGPDAALRARARGLLERVGLSDRTGHRPGELSGGQQQRVALARALINAPSLVLADEPTGNLDTQSADGVFALLRGINHEQRTTFLLVTHDRRLADRCDRVIELIDGRVVGESG